MVSLTTEVTINSNAIEDKLNALLDDDTMLKIQQLFAETIDPWTPFRSGALSTDITISPDGVQYNVDYAADKYYGEAYTHTVHPLATSHWDEVAMQTELDALTENVKTILIERARELYG